MHSTDGFSQDGRQSPTASIKGSVSMSNFSGKLSRSDSESKMRARPDWNDRHHLMMSRDNHMIPNGQRDYFDRPRDLRITVPEGHDGISEPFERNPSLHWLKYTESPKMQRLRSMTDPEGETGGNSPKSPKSPQAGFLPTSPKSQMSRSDTRGTAYIPECGVGSPTGTETKPHFQRSQSWYLDKEKPDFKKRREVTGSTHYSVKYGQGKRQASVPPGTSVYIDGLTGGQKALNKMEGKVSGNNDGGLVEVKLDPGQGVNAPLPVILDGLRELKQHKMLHRSRGTVVDYDSVNSKYTIRLPTKELVRVGADTVAFLVPRRGLKVPWNNRWHMTPSMMGNTLYNTAREYFDKPSRLYTSQGEDWRHMYGDGCENLTWRVPGTPQPQPVYGWHSLRLQRAASQDANRDISVGEI
jgi:hypothetical protein